MSTTTDHAQPTGEIICKKKRAIFSRTRIALSPVVHAPGKGFFSLAVRYPCYVILLALCSDFHFQSRVRHLETSFLMITLLIHGQNENIFFLPYTSVRAL